MTQSVQVVEGRENVLSFTYMQVARALAVEIVRPGMQLTRISGLTAARNHGLIGPGRTTKKAALKAVVRIVRERVPSWEPDGTIAQALTK
jgi:hypothetical protein